VKNKVLYKFDQFPLSICTQSGKLSKTEKLIPAEIVQKSNGLIQFSPYINPIDIYMTQHSNCIGDTWKYHNKLFTDFVLTYEAENITEIGGGAGHVYKLYMEKNNNLKNWKVIDLNPSEIYTLNGATIVSGLYDPTQINSGETVISSHFVEHIYDLDKFLVELHKQSPKYHIFSLPNFRGFSKSNSTSTIMFEHPNYLSEDYLDYTLLKNGWKVVEKKYYKNHSIFYVTEPLENTNSSNFLEFDNSEDIINLIEFFKKRALSLRDKKFYVFGAHFTYYYLLNMGISEEQIIGVIDNDTSKQNRRMYGTNTMVYSPKDIPSGSDIFVEMGVYNEEIIQNLKNFNLI
jgi:hypothetical protein